MVLFKGEITCRYRRLNTVDCYVFNVLQLHQWAKQKEEYCRGRESCRSKFNSFLCIVLVLPFLLTSLWWLSRWRLYDSYNPFPVFIHALVIVAKLGHFSNFREQSRGYRSARRRTNSDSPLPNPAMRAAKIDSQCLTKQFQRVAVFKTFYKRKQFVVK